jgi:flavin-dependent dehydrogenase
MFPRSSWMHRLDLDKFDVLVVGAGLSGTVLADLYAREQGKRVLVVDRRPRHRDLFHVMLPGGS